jgi:multiple sugar transport system substrate-binding protein
MSGVMKTEFDLLLDEFNGGPGQKTGISVKVDASMERQALQETLLMAAANDPGAPALPDMAVLYPAFAAQLSGRRGLLADFRGLFSAEELARYVPEFLEEGRLGLKDGPVYVLPLCKSTELLFVNATLFNRFASEYPARYGGNAPSYADLATMEGIFDLSEKYYRYTDDETPDIPNDGKAFFFPETIFNIFMAGFEQLGESFIVDGAVNADSPVFARIRDFLRTGFARGYFPVFNGFGNNLARSAAVICATGSSASATYYPNMVTYANNTHEQVEFIPLPYPVFSGGKRAAIQRGGGMAVLKSTEPREYAAAFFLKWFTAPEQNLRFAAGTGYMPVEQAAFAKALAGGLGFEKELVRKTFDAVLEMRRDYAFFVPPVFNGFEALQNRFAGEFALAGAAR